MTRKFAVMLRGIKGGIRAVWTVIYIAQNKAVAEKYKQVLTDEGLLVQVRPIGTSPVREHTSFEILVPESEAEEAHEIITELLGS